MHMRIMTSYKTNVLTLGFHQVKENKFTGERKYVNSLCMLLIPQTAWLLVEILLGIQRYCW
jgi:hypothetical protein